MMKFNIVRAIFGIFLSTALSSCALLGPPPKANVSLVDLQFSEMTLFETTADVSVRIENLNADTLTIKGGTHTVSVNGSELGTGLSDESLTLSAHSSGVQHVKLHISNLTALSKIKSIVDSKNFDFEIKSEITASLNGFSHTIDLTQKGRFSQTDFMP